MLRRLLAFSICVAALVLAAPAGASAAADLQAQITGPDPVVAGSNATFVLTVSNVGDAAAHNVTVQSATPLNTTFVSWTPQSSGWTPGSMPGPGGTGMITATKPLLESGASEQFTLVVKVDPGAASGADASASVHVSSSPPDANPSNNDATSAANVIVRPDLGVTVSAPSTILPGGALTSTYVVTNNGPSNARDVALGVDVPEGTTFGSLNQDTGPSFTAPTSNGANRHTVTISTLAAGATATFTQHVTAKATLPDPADITSFARVSTSNNDPAPANDSAAAVTTEGTKADLVVTNTPVPASVAPGGQVTYLVAVANRGVDAHSVSLTDSLPPGSAFVSASQVDGPAFSCATPAVGSARDVTCTLGTLPARASAHFAVVARISLTAARPSTVDSTATATAATTDANPANNSATARVGITAGRGVDLAVKGSVKPRSPRKRRLITFIYKVANNGDVAATGVTFTATLPRGFQFAGAIGAGHICILRTRTVTCTIARLAAGARVRVTLLGTRAKPGLLTVKARVTSAQPDLSRADNAAMVRVRVRR